MRLFALLLLLTACFGGAETEDTEHLRTAQSGMRTGAELVPLDEDETPPIPAAIAGMLAGGTVSGNDADGMGIPDPLDLVGVGTGTAADTELLNTLVSLLSTDVQALLNRASNREDALDTYRASLESHAQRGHIRLRAMQDSLEENEDKKTRHERRIRDLRGEIDDAISEGNTSHVSTLTDELIRKQQALAEADSAIIVEEHLIEAYEDVLSPMGERAKAINANREALIQGVKVTDMPGVDDLEIIEYEDGKIRVGRRSRGFF